MAENLGNVFQSAIENLQQMREQLEGGESARKSTSSFTLQDFWLKLEEQSKRVSHEVTKMCLAYSKDPTPGSDEAQSQISAVEAACSSLVSVFYSFTKEHGLTLRNECHKAVLKVVEPVIEILKSVKEKGKEGQKERLKLAGWVWEACESIRTLPKSNLQAACRTLHREETMIIDALQEIEEEVRSDKDSQERLLDIDNSEVWNNMDRELLPPCVGLVKTARACIKKVTLAVRKNGKCDTEERISQLDDLVTMVEPLSPAVDDFIMAVYPPMNREAVKSQAIRVVNRMQQILQLVQSSHYVTEEDQKWVRFLLNAVDHNNNKLQPLLTPDMDSSND